MSGRCDIIGRGALRSPDRLPGRDALQVRMSLRPMPIGDIPAGRPRCRPLSQGQLGDATARTSSRSLQDATSARVPLPGRPGQRHVGWPGAVFSSSSSSEPPGGRRVRARIDWKYALGSRTTRVPLQGADRVRPLVGPGGALLFDGCRAVIRPPGPARASSDRLHAVRPRATATLELVAEALRAASTTSRGRAGTGPRTISPRSVRAVWTPVGLVRLPRARRARGLPWRSVRLCLLLPPWPYQGHARPAKYPGATLRYVWRVICPRCRRPALAFHAELPPGAARIPSPYDRSALSMKRSSAGRSSCTCGGLDDDMPS